MVVSHNGASERDLIEYSRKNLGAHFIPRYFLLVDSLPKSHTGKVAKGKLPQLARDLLTQTSHEVSEG
jgi:acyl-CoA synthetase (AMP-forming)/AMP-acid ligase II